MVLVLGCAFYRYAARLLQGLAENPWRVQGFFSPKTLDTGPQVRHPRPARVPNENEKHSHLARQFYHNARRMSIRISNFFLDENEKHSHLGTLAGARVPPAAADVKNFFRLAYPGPRCQYVYVRIYERGCL